MTLIIAELQNCREVTRCKRLLSSNLCPQNPNYRCSNADKQASNQEFVCSYLAELDLQLVPQDWYSGTNAVGRRAGSTAFGYQATEAEAKNSGQSNEKIKEFNNFYQGKRAIAPAAPVLLAPLAVGTQSFTVPALEGWTAELTKGLLKVVPIGFDHNLTIVRRGHWPLGNMTFSCSFIKSATKVHVMSKHVLLSQFPLTVTRTVALFVKRL